MCYNVDLEIAKMKVEVKQLNGFEKITLDISNICNAKCKWCTTGINNRSKASISRFMRANEFEDIINYCLDHSIINQNSDVELYSWGEPFLNPEILDILDIIVEKGIGGYNLSTNGSKVVTLRK